VGVWSLNRLITESFSEEVIFEQIPSDVKE
jgi:hypothetical protein